MRTRHHLFTVTATALMLMSGAAQPAGAVTVSGTIHPGKTLSQGDVLVSPGGQHRLWIGPEVDTEGLVLGGNCAEDVLVQVPSNAKTRLEMQQDGNLVLRADGKAVWSTRTAGNPGARAVLQADRNLVIYSATNKVLWQSRTVCSQLWNSDAVIGDPLATELTAGQYMQSPNRTYTLIMQTDGNLVLYRPGKALWSSRTRGTGNTFVHEVNGELKVKNSAGRVLWRSGAGAPNRFPMQLRTLALQTDGNLVAYRVSDDLTKYTPVWSTRTAGR